MTVGPRTAAAGLGGASRVTVGVFGALAALVGIEHGIGAIAQGDVPLPGPVFPSWPGSEAFAVLAGEPALTLVPGARLTGVLAVLVSAAFLAWVVLLCATPLSHRRYGGLGLIALSIPMLLLGAGFGPPLLGTVVGVGAVAASAPAHRPRGARRPLAAAWPWALGGGLLAWLLLLPGTVLFSVWLRPDLPGLVVPVLTVTALGLTVLALASARVRDQGTGDPAGRDRAGARGSAG